VFGGDAAIVIENKYSAHIIENCSGNFRNDVITYNRTEDNAIVWLENLNFTLEEGKKLINSKNTKMHQVFMVNITINGEKMTQESIAKYLENVEWYQVVSEDIWENN
jgi:hypothetical protein